MPHPQLSKGSRQMTSINIGWLRCQCRAIAQNTVRICLQSITLSDQPTRALTTRHLRHKSVRWFGYSSYTTCTTISNQNTVIHLFCNSRLPSDLAGNTPMRFCLTQVDSRAEYLALQYFRKTNAILRFVRRPLVSNSVLKLTHA